MVLVMTDSLAHAGPVLYPAPAGLAPSALYEVSINGKALFVYPCQVGAAVQDEHGTIDPNPPETTTPRPAKSSSSSPTAAKAACGIRSSPTQMALTWN